MASRAAPAGTQAVVRALRVLKALAACDDAPGLAELAADVELPKTTAHRLLAALEAEGLVARDAARQGYRLGPEAMALGLQALRTSDLRGAARPMLEGLAADSGETASLEVLVDDQVLVLDEVAGRHLVAAQAAIGTRWPLHVTSTGKAILAALPAEERERIVGVGLTRWTTGTITEEGALRRELAAVERRGYAVAFEELEPGFAAVGAAVRDATGRVVGALSVGGPTARLGRQRALSLGPRVAAAAVELSRRLGSGR